MKLQSFAGFRGRAAMVRIGEIDFMIVARTEEQLGLLYASILPKAEPFNPEACQRAIVISEKIFPKLKKQP